MRKDLLTKRQKRLEERRDALTAKALASESADEVRSINAQLVELNEDIEDIKAELATLDSEARSIPADAKLVNGSVVGSFKAEERKENPLASMEYRTAFMKYIQTGAPIEKRGDVITTGDTAAAIPITVMNEVINTVRKRYGSLYNRVLKTTMKGGIEFPVGALQATFKWITETTVSPRQKLDPLAKVMFSYHTAEIRIAQSVLASIVTLEAFEAKIAEVIAIAYLQAMDYGIVNGTGNGQMLGILNDPRVAATNNVVTMSASDINDWKKWRTKFFSKLPLGYRNGEFIFPLSTVESYLETMSDQIGNPVFRQATGLEVNDGDAQEPYGRFFGRYISLVEPDILPDFDTANAGDVIGIFWQPDQYAVNENFGFTMRRYYDEETNEWVDKVLVVVDGKVLNPQGYWLIKKGS